MMLPTSLKDLYVTPADPPTMVVAAAEETDVLSAAVQAGRLGIVRPVLVGDLSRIRRIAAEANVSVDEIEIIDASEPAEAAQQAVKLVAGGSAQLLMKGLVDTSVLLKAVLDKEYGLRSGRVLSHVALFQVPRFDRLLTVTDAAMNIAPDLETKEQILLNAVDFLHSIGYKEPNVAVLAAKEKVNPKMPATLDAAELTHRSRDGRYPACKVSGPFALDNAVSIEAARTKGIDDPVAGKADILLAPTIEAGNILYKSLAFLGHAESAGIIVGAAAPVVLTSRADSERVKLHSIAIAARAAYT